uniref:Uncharacterized protein n=1 Tax=Rhodnius prolixus TaxID=13249 RepID=T1IG83_RHOPR
MASAFPNYEEEDPEIREIEVLVDDLVKYFEERRFQHEEIVKRGEALEEIMLRHQENLIRENEFLFLLKIGQLYSLTKKDKKVAMDVLSKVVEHDPNVAEAWDALAVCYWDLHDCEKAKFCLENSLRQGRRKVPLRNMSVICRKLSNKYPDKKFSFLEECINLAKEAVEKDVKDGISWGVLGNAYLSAHFKLMKDMDYANLALTSYKEAVNMGTTFNAELYFHQGYVNAFCENYKEALTSLDNAIALDTVKQEPFLLKNELISFLNNDIQNSQIAKSLKVESTSEGSSQFGEDHRMFVHGKVIWSTPKAIYLPV